MLGEESTSKSVMRNFWTPHPIIYSILLVIGKQVRQGKRYFFERILFVIPWVIT